MFAWIRNIDLEIWLLSAVIAVVVGAFGLVVASEVAQENGIHEGTVSAKDHHNAYSTSTCTGKPLVCYPIYHPERWSVTIVDGDDSNWFYLPESQWVSINEGDYLTFHGDALVNER